MDERLKKAYWLKKDFGNYKKGKYLGSPDSIVSSKHGVTYCFFIFDYSAGFDFSITEDFLTDTKIKWLADEFQVLKITNLDWENDFKPASPKDKIFDNEEAARLYHNELKERKSWNIITSANDRKVTVQRADKSVTLECKTNMDLKDDIVKNLILLAKNIIHFNS
jgi:hypothetical protein